MGLAMGLSILATNLFDGASGLLDILTGTLTVVFNEIFSPVMMEILQIFVELAITNVMIQFSYLYYLVLIFLCKIIDILETILNIFVGTEKVSLSGGEPMPLLNAIFQLDVVSRAFIAVTVTAVVICFIFTIFATARSISSMTLENQNPISHVLKNAMKSCVTFMLVPFMCVFMLQLSGALTSQIETAILSQTGNEKPQTIGMYIFLTASLRAGKEDAVGLGNGLISYKLLQPDFDDELRREYRFGEKNYLDIKDSGMDFSQFDIDYPIGYISSVFMLIMLVGLIVMFIRRMMELIMLYIVSPFFVATIPIDDGAMFKNWRERFIAKFVSGFGVLFVLKIYLILLPILFSPKLDLGTAVLGERMTAVESVETFLGDTVDDIPGIDKSQATDVKGVISEMAIIRDAEEQGSYNSVSNNVTNFVYDKLGIGQPRTKSMEASLLDSLMKIIFMMGGTWAIYKSRTLIVEVMNPDEERMARSASAMGLRVAAKGVEAAKTAAEVTGMVAAGVVTAGAGTGVAAGAKGAAVAGKTAAKGGMTAAKFGKKVAYKSALNAVNKVYGSVTQAGQEDTQE